MTCRRSGKATGGPPELTGRIAFDDLERRMAAGNTSRCHTLWVALYGAQCDFDDLHVALAEQLGLVLNEHDDLSSLLSSTHDTVENCELGWDQLRRLAISLFWEHRADSAVEVAAFDPRTWEQATDDCLFDAGGCIACAIGVPGDVSDHRTLAGWVLHRRTSWDQVAAAVARSAAG